jgi:hypothetical protein
MIQGLVHRANKLCHNEQDNLDRVGFSEEGNLWIQLLAKKNPDKKKDDNDNKSVYIQCHTLEKFHINLKEWMKDLT